MFVKSLEEGVLGIEKLMKLFDSLTVFVIRYYNQYKGNLETLELLIPSAREISEMVDLISKELNLTDDQRIQISNVFMAYFASAIEKIKGGITNKEQMVIIKKDFKEVLTELIL